MKYLQDYSYYEDLYDIHTIEQCLNWFNGMKAGMEKHRSEFVPEPPHHTDFDHEVLKVCSYTVNTLAAERYRHKKETIRDWMDKDKIKQDFFDSAIPEDPICEKCGSLMQVIDKTLHDYLDKPTKVSFIYECLKCKARIIRYSDGSPWDYQKPTCPECGGALKDKCTEKKEVLTITSSCKSCKYKTIDVTDFKKSREEREKEEKRSKWLLQEYKEQFCLNDSNGPEALRSIDGISRLVKEWRERDKKEANPVYQKVKQLKTLKFNQLKELIAKSVDAEGYADLQFQAPEMGRNVIIPFTLSDSHSDRHEYGSRNNLRKLLIKSLEHTNWRLMSEGISYRLGILSGRLKAYESEEDLMKIVK